MPSVVGLLEQREVAARRRVDELREETDRIQDELAAAERYGKEWAIARARAGEVLTPMDEAAQGPAETGPGVSAAGVPCDHGPRVFRTVEAGARRPMTTAGSTSQVIRPDHRARVLHEDHRPRGDLRVRLGGVVAVVQTDADDLAARATGTPSRTPSASGSGSAPAATARSFTGVSLPWAVVGCLPPTVDHRHGHGRR